MSPYSEKLRLALGIYHRKWLSFAVPAQPPRPFLRGLIGGYRRIPVLQLGAHFFCDSRLAIIALEGESAALGAVAPEDQSLCRTAEEEIFFAVMAAAPTRRVVRYLLKNVGLMGLPRFLKDRASMMTNATVTLPSRTDARDQIARFGAELGARLKTQAFLSGSKVGLIDLCCYHPLWMGANLDRALVATLPECVSRWMTSVKQFGHGTSSEASESTVMSAIARDSNEDNGLRIDAMPFEPYQSVGVGPSDYGRDISTGQLVKIDSLEIVIRRSLDTGGYVYLHFPCQGFEVSAA